MATSYSDRLGEWVKRRKSTRHAKNVAAFLAVKDDVKAALDAGFSVKTIWLNLQEERRLPLGYNTFLNYINREIRRPQANPVLHVAPPPSKASNQQAKQGEPSERARRATPDKIAGFTFNSVPRKEDLL